MTIAEVKAGVLRLGSAQVNWYLIEDEQSITVVDAGFPAHISQLVDALAARRRTLDDVAALILTHGHSDHIGFAEQLRVDTDVPVLVHEDDAAMVTTGERPPSERPFADYQGNAAMQAFAAEMSEAGGMQAPLIGEVQTFADGETLDVPGRPTVVHTPGHSHGHAALVFATHGVIIAGDALCTHNVATGRTGAQIAAAGFNVSSNQALASLDRLAGIDGTVLVGHGDPWTNGIDAAIKEARRLGPS